MNPFQIIKDILAIVERDLKGKSAKVIAVAAQGTGKIALRITEICSLTLIGELDIKESMNLLEGQYEALEIVIMASIGEEEVAAEQVANGLLNDVKEVVLGAIGHLIP